MMNNGNEISHHTKLYGFIGEYAGQSSLSATLNKHFKAENRDAMMIPMNIREDDLYFTVVNMKKSHVNGALISNEYMKGVVEVLDDSSEAVKLCGMCDILIRDEQKLVGDIVGVRALVKLLKNRGVQRVALIGVDSRAKAFAFFADGFDVSYFYDDLEKLMGFTNEIGVTDADINRIAEGMDIDLSAYDAVVDFSDFENLEMVKAFAKINADMKQKKEFSPLKARTNELLAAYIGFDDMLGELSSTVFEFLKDKKHLEHDKSDMRF
ncbi:hypothetical protein [Sulfurimonas sp.]|uniref:hypothetical protein n=1 Tax=Sulfurimonas sp. TaxID=2022749 RepID=UPI0025E68ECF|nr:hypothetical protein [Sulfurimonas sp.]MBW6488149.1 hypothetical protein [Sulfurimonas sp.]